MEKSCSVCGEDKKKEVVIVGKTGTVCESCILTCAALVKTFTVRLERR